MSWAECARCGRVFSSVSGFDMHQKYAFGTPVPITCLDPAVLGMHRNQQGRWALPGWDARSGVPGQNLRAEQ